MYGQVIRQMKNTVRTEYGDAYDGDYKLTFWDDKEYSCSVYKTYTNIPNGTYKFSIWAKTKWETGCFTTLCKKLWRK